MIAMILLTLGALNAALAMTVSTCPNGEADSLAGGALTLLLYVGALLGMLIAPPKRSSTFLLVPAIGLAVWHTWFAAIFSWGFWADSLSACAAMGIQFGDAGQDMDGREVAFTFLWCGLSLMFWLAIAAGWWRIRRVSNVR